MSNSKAITQPLVTTPTAFSDKLSPQSATFEATSLQSIPTRNKKSIIAATICLTFGIILIICGVILLIIRNTATSDTDALTSELKSLSTTTTELREKESQILAESGFSSEYYDALAATSAVVERQYQIEDILENSEPDSSFNFAPLLFASAAVFFVVATTILLKKG